METSNKIALGALLVALGTATYTFVSDYRDWRATADEQATRVRCSPAGDTPEVRNFSGSKEVVLRRWAFWRRQEKDDSGGWSPNQEILLKPLAAYQPNVVVTDEMKIAKLWVLWVSEDLPTVRGIDCTYRHQGPKKWPRLILTGEEFFEVDPQDVQNLEHPWWMTDELEAAE